MKEFVMPDTQQDSAKLENQFHIYRGNTIPWYVRAMWLGFWIFTIVYTIRYLFPAIQTELFQK
jgi:hypothetical protein